MVFINDNFEAERDRSRLSRLFFLEPQDSAVIFVNSEWSTVIYSYIKKQLVIHI